MTHPPAAGPQVSTLLAFAGLLLWDLTGLDLVLASGWGDVHGFRFREHWLFSTVLHSGARWLAWSLTLALCLGIWWPVGALRRLPLTRRVQLPVTMLLAGCAVSLLKAFSTTSCPWDLSAYGGIAQHVSHWALGARDGGSGHCFPAGHACVGFAFIGGYFSFRESDRTVARRWLAGALTGGFVLGWAQQVRGAHFMSHTFWSAWICWVVAFALDGVFRPRRWKWA